MSEPSSEVNPLDALAEEFVARHRAGEHPSLDEYIARRPDLADDIRDLFPGLVLMEGVRPDQGDSTGPFAGGPAPTLKRLGDFRILREVGRGGMGVVYEAEQESLGRHVALKVLPAHALMEPQRLRRFQREAKAAARLHHTNIVPVHGVGEQEGLHYYVMQFIQGQGLDQVLRELRRLRPAPPVEGPVVVGSGDPAVLEGRDTASAASAAQSLLSGRFESAPTQAESPSDSGGSSSSVRLPGQTEGTLPSRSGREYWRSVARVGVQVADALAYAHGQGVLHRDVKPSNLLLDAHGNVWVTDFGLAKAADSEDLTHTGDIVGTLRYMAPECFRGKADPRSDVYSLGLTLYELLTLRPAFVGKNNHQLLAEVVHGEPPRPRSVSREIPNDLETVVLKAISRDASHRYQTAAELADDLRRFVDDRPVKARRVGMAEQVWRWARRNPALAWMTTAAVLLLVVGTTASLIAAYWFSVVAADANRQRAKADKLAADEAKARDEADNANIEIKKKADQLLDDFKRLNRANALLESARLHNDAGECNQALADYNAAIEQRPDMSLVWLLRGQFYLQYFCWDEAAADFAKGFELQAPADPSLWQEHAYLRLYLGDRDGYRRVCAGMLDKFGQTTDPNTITGLTTTCTAAPNALDDYTRLIQLVEKAGLSTAAGTVYASPMRQAGNLDEDVEHAIPSQQFSFTGALLSLKFRAGKIDQVLRILDAAAKKNVNTGFDVAQLAMTYHQAGQDDKAREQLNILNQGYDTQVTQLPAQSVDNTAPMQMPNFDLGSYLLYREALLAVDGSTAGEHPLQWIVRSRGRAALGQWDEATAAIARAIALRPKDVLPRLEHSRLLAKQGRWKEAGDDLDEVLKQHTDDGNVWFERGRLHAQQSQWELAAADYNQALERYNFNNGELNSAIPNEMVQVDGAYDAVVRLRPRDAHLWYQRALTLDQNGKEADARTAYAKALELRPNDDFLLYQRGSFFGQHEHW
ncbi:MAG TPA: protein kinase, partial [Gemmataceae bacterium]|nr:protein kinase [Gemmataceae bacterium]